MLETVKEYGVVPERAFINRPAIEVDRFRRRTPYTARTDGPYRLLSTGRLHWKKGFDIALLAVRDLLDSGLDVHYEIIGGGAEEERLRYAIRDLRLGDRVELLGARPPEFVRERLEAADAFVLPSVSEGLSNAALEAMAMEVPLISTTAGGMAEAIEDGCEGLLAPPWDANALAARLCQLLTDPALRVRLGAAARRRVEREFALGRQIACFVDEYRRLVDGRD
jgi:colanic acid/amylovoran biosynthesis glycosyltransferase